MTQTQELLDIAIDAVSDTINTIGLADLDPAIAVQAVSFMKLGNQPPNDEEGATGPQGLSNAVSKALQKADRSLLITKTGHSLLMELVRCEALRPSAPRDTSALDDLGGLL